VIINPTSKGKSSAMPKPRVKQEVQAQYFRWLLGQRNGVYFADGRANATPLGRHSLSTRDPVEALAELKQLDLTMAVQLGLADATLIKTDACQILSWSDGRKVYESYIQRPAIAGGPRGSTAKRYRAVLDKFIAFAESQGRRTWNELNRQLLDDYAGWLDGESYEYATQYLELTTLKQVHKFLIENDHLPKSVAFSYPVRKPDGTDTYCWRPEEVAVILTHCNTPDLCWLRYVIIGLAATGLRISELAGLRWTDINLERGLITLTDETMKKSRGKEKRTTKSGRDRTFPIQESLRDILISLPHHSDGRVFHGPLGGKIKADTVRRILVRDVLTPLAGQFPSEPGEPGFVDGRLHSFRHYFCSNCANRGVKERVLMSWLGHRSSRMVHRYYHLHDDESIRQMQQVQLY
jgi:integrase